MHRKLSFWQLQYKEQCNKMCIVDILNMNVTFDSFLMILCTTGYFGLLLWPPRRPSKEEH